MRQIARSPLPEILAVNSAPWTTDLLAAMSGVQQEKYGEILSSSRVRNRYAHAQVLEELQKMFKKLCCYCEACLGICSWEHVDHYLPKRDFPEFTFDWANLYLACPKCNTLKSNKFSSDTPLLDPVTDLPDSHLQFFGETLAARTLRGGYTIATLGLNREELVEDRRGILARVNSQLAAIRTAVTTALDVGGSDAAKSIQVSECQRWLGEVRKLMEHGGTHSAMLLQAVGTSLDSLESDLGLLMKKLSS